MELDNIEKLIEKYFEATTTPAEEEILINYFSQKGVAVHLEQYAPIFQYYSKAKAEHSTQKMPLNLKKNYFNRVVVAVVTTLIISVYFANEYRVKQQQRAYAFNETKKAISLLTLNFNKVTEKIIYLNEFEVTKQKIYKHN